MPVTKSAKGAQRVSERRHQENLVVKTVYKKAVKVAKKAAAEGLAELDQLLSKAQSALDRAAKVNTIHANKASRLKSRMAKAAVAGTPVAPTKKKASSTKTGKARNTKAVVAKKTAKK